MKISAQIFLISLFSAIVPLGIVLFLVFFDKWDLLNRIYFLPVLSLLPNQESILFLLALCAVFIVLLLGAVVGAKITRSLEDLVEAIVSLVNGEDNFDLPILQERGGEIGEIAECLGLISEKNRALEQELKDLKSTFEIEGKKRIKELEITAQNMEGKAEEKKYELQQRIEELERFRNLSVGRELKMIELKKALQKAEEELERAGIKVSAKPKKE